MKKTLSISRNANSFVSHDRPIQFPDSVDSISTGQIEILLETALKLSDSNNFHCLGIKISEALELIGKKT